MMIAGGGSMVLGIIVTAAAWAEGGSESGYTFGTVLFFGGAATFLASIPVIIIGHVKMDKSRVRLTAQQTIVQPLPRIAMRVPSVGITISL